MAVLVIAAPAIRYARSTGEEPRQEADLQGYLAERLRERGAATDVWEPAPEDVAGSRQIEPGLEFAGRPQLAATFTGEPRRESLIEPPAGYRTPSPNQPYGIGKDTWIAPKIDRQEPAK